MIGRDYVLGLASGPQWCHASEAMRQLHDHAIGWVATVDSLVVEGGLQVLIALHVADKGFRGDSVNAARAYRGNK